MTNEITTINSAEQLISQAIDKSVPVETMERLLAMRRELKAEWAKEQYDKAMAEFQADCPVIVKTKEVKTKSGIVAYRYAPIESIVEQVKPFLQKHGFSYSVQQELKDAGVKVTCRAVHRDGHSENHPMEVPFGTKTDIMSQTQVVAAASTFAKRYAFCNAFGILTGDEDTDAAPQPTTTVKQQVAPTQTVVPKPIQKTDDRKAKIKKLCDDKNPLLITKEAYKEFVKKETGLDLSKEENYDQIIQKLEVKEIAKTFEGEVVDNSPAAKMRSGMAK